MKKGVKVYKRHFTITSGKIINDFLFKDAKFLENNTTTIYKKNYLPLMSTKINCSLYMNSSGYS